jgi:hypothetical protein
MPPYGQPTKPKNTKRTVKSPSGAQVYLRGKNLDEKVKSANRAINSAIQSLPITGTGSANKFFKVAAATDAGLSAEYAKIAKINEYKEVRDSASDTSKQYTKTEKRYSNLSNKVKTQSTMSKKKRPSAKK